MTYSCWLLPVEADAIPFQNVINQLATRQSTPNFLPHLTLGGLSDRAKDMSELLRALKGLELETLEIDATPIFTMSLFLRFKLNDQILRARSALEALPEFSRGRDFDPHISLCYGAPPEGAADSDEVKALLQAPVAFDRLQLVKINSPVKSYADVAGWKLNESFIF